jgi:hypothetical protein
MQAPDWIKNIFLHNLPEFKTAGCEHLVCINDDQDNLAGLFHYKQST